MRYQKNNLLLWTTLIFLMFITTVLNENLSESASVQNSADQQAKTAEQPLEVFTDSEFALKKGEFAKLSLADVRITIQEIIDYTSQGCLGGPVGCQDRVEIIATRGNAIEKVSLYVAHTVWQEEQQINRSKVFDETISLVRLVTGSAILKIQKASDQSYVPSDLKLREQEPDMGIGPNLAVQPLLPSNPLVNNPNADATERDTQSETAIVQGTGSTVIAAFNDSGSSIGSGNHFTGFSVSADSGATWTDGGTLPSSSSGDLGDPVLARSAATGTVFLSTLGNVNRSVIQIFRSTNNGGTFLTPVNGAPGFNTTTGNHDKEWIAVDNFPGSGYGNVYMAWRNFGSASGITFTRSTNDGVTWQPSPGLILNTGGQGTFVTVGLDHSVNVFWYEGGSPQKIRMRKSTDQGVSFGAAITVTTLLTTGANGDLGLGFRSNAFPHVAVNPISGNLYIVYNDNPAGSDRCNTYFRQSTDGGATWSSAIQLNADGTTKDQWSPSIAVTPNGSTLMVAWYDRRSDPANSLIEYWGVTASISANTVTFGSNFAISSQFPAVYGVDPAVDPVYMGDYDHVVADNQYFYLTWGDNRDMSIFPGATRKNANVRSAVIPTVGVNNSAFVSQTVPASMTAGQSYSVSIIMTNTGTTTWTSASGYKLGSQNPQDNITWGFNRVALPVSVPQNTQVTFNFTVTAPLTPGNYNFQWRMLRENVEWFGAYTPNVVVAVVTAAQPPYPPGARAIPGLIEAEHFDLGGEGVAYHDNEAANLGGQFRTSEGVDITTTGDVGGGYIVGWIVPGEWLEYTVNVPTAGAYTLEARVAAFNYGGSFHVEFNQVNVTLGGIPIPNTGGWDTWVTVRKNVTLSAGNNQIMRIAMDTPGYYGYVGNINKVRLAQYQGYLDAADCQFIYGWAWDKGQPNTPINVDIYSDGAFLTTYPANAFRQDLLDAGIGNGYHAFAFPVPASLKNGQPHSIAVKYSGTIDSLIGSPRTITCGGASISIVWILPAEETWGPQGSLTAAGYALNGSGGVQLVWRDATINGPWNVVAYQATPSPVDGSWSNTIPAPTDRCHIYQAYANYSGVTSSTFTYNGVAQGDCTIQVVSGTYGGNCGAPTGNATWHLAPTCNGQTNCNYTVSVYTLGDPVPGCAKDYVARWTCGGGSTIKIATVPPEAGWGSVVNLICP